MISYLAKESQHIAFFNFMEECKPSIFSQVLAACVVPDIAIGFPEFCSYNPEYLTFLENSGLRLAFLPSASSNTKEIQASESEVVTPSYSF
jgi:hypothetical protein